MVMDDAMVPREMTWRVRKGGKYKIKKIGEGGCFQESGNFKWCRKSDRKIQTYLQC